ncbi:MAG: RNA polymerase sigma factor [Calditrichaeota bacterium]|nr:MAG: RNA polymerase sigma factor [Calditrichota bacterium]MBL1203918.1 RNA polymerase sigma factor [Calditrichota bacterium]NOG43751.1 RNA polymerase sigma factor [Calditrichota bacterium]
MHNDLELINKTLANNLSAYDELMQRYERLVYTISFGFGKNKENALDITQNVFIKCYQKLSTFKAKSSFKSWLTKISYNEGVNWVRSNQKFSKHESIDEHLDLPSIALSNEDEYLAKENKSQLLRSLYNLNTRYRLAVVLRYFEEQSIKEIAETLQCSEGVVKNMLFRSLQKLKENLKKNEERES